MFCLLCGFVACTAVSVGSDDSLAFCIQHLFLKPSSLVGSCKEMKICSTFYHLY